MFLTSSIYRVILFVSIQIIIVNATTRNEQRQDYNATDSSNQSELEVFRDYQIPRNGRSKRSLFDEMPKIMKVRIMLPTGKIIHSEWIKQHQYLANEYLPITMSSGYLDGNTMKDVGEFIVYQDLKNLVSVVYFKELNAFFGHIGMGYFITYLPYKFDEVTGSYSGVVREPFVVASSSYRGHTFPSLFDTDVDMDSFGPSDDDSVRIPKREFSSDSHDSDEGPSVKQERFTRYLHEENLGPKMNVNASDVGNIRKRRGVRISEYYLESLVFVTRDMADIFKQFPNVDRNIGWVVRYCIIYLNAVDMSFKLMPLGSPDFRINIARIVIEDDSAPFRFISNGEFQYPQSVALLRNDIESRKHIFSPDSFDHIFLITSLPIVENGRQLRAISESDMDIYEAKKAGRFYSAVPLTVFNYKTDYAVVVHEIGRTLSLRVDATLDEFECSQTCSGFMQKGASKCDNCLKWSYESYVQYLKFTRDNRKRCVLMNAPRSLRPPGPSVYLSPYKQCVCYGYDSFVSLAHRLQKDYVRTTECDVPLKCRNYDDGSFSHHDIPHPLDGTICGNRNKVCWDGVCVFYEKKTCPTLNI